MKALALNLVVVMTIAVASLALMLSFFSGPVVQMLTDTFCFFNDNVFAGIGVDVARDVCPDETACRGERVIIESDNKQYFKSQLAARTLLCWRQKLPACGAESVCYEIIMKQNLQAALTEEEFTQYLEREGACSAIENSWVFDAAGGKPSSCGDEELIIWSAKDNVIKDQSIVLVKYDLKNNRIVMDAGGTAKRADRIVCENAEKDNICGTQIGRAHV